MNLSLFINRDDDSTYIVLLFNINKIQTIFDIDRIARENGIINDILFILHSRQALLDLTAFLVTLIN